MIIESNTSKAIVTLEDGENYPEFVVIVMDRVRKFPKTSCSHCGKTIYVRKKRNNQFCSKDCRHLYSTFKVQCAWCNIDIEKDNSDKTASNSGLFFCSRTCKDIAQRIGGIKEIQPPHYGSVSTDYRATAYRNKEYRCEVCGLDNWLGTNITLDVHHIDGDRSNNIDSNLQVVCPNCHRILEMNKWASA